MMTRAIARLAAALLAGTAMTGCEGSGGGRSTGAGSTPSGSSPAISSVTTAPTASSPTVAMPSGITLTAKFGGGLGHASITVPKGWKSAGGFANVQASADNPSGSQSVDLILAPGASHFPIGAQARVQAHDYREGSGKPAAIHPSFEAGGLRFAFVTGVSPDGYDSTTFARNVALVAGGYGGISVTFEFEPSTPQSVRRALYLTVLSSLDYR